ncbi:hypothetical protein TNCV_3953581 [Trichonephila clavipes]|nr:hypothetical protein TNCV_3953581 [Trichonephila clavipes]
MQAVTRRAKKSDKAPWWSPAVFLDKFSPIVRPAHEHSLLDAVAFPLYLRHARLERDLVIWLAKEVFGKLGPADKRNGTPDNYSWLRACVACNSESRIGTLPWASPDTSSMIVRTQLEAGFVAKHYKPQYA